MQKDEEHGVFKRINIYIDSVTICVGMMNEARLTVFIWMTIVISEVIK
jgi:hypothetical protein